MRRLLISNTHYQTIIAIQLKETIFKEDDVILLISDHSKGSEEISMKIGELGIFEDVHYILTRELSYGYTRKDSYSDFFAISFCDKNRYSYYLQGIDDIYFDEIVVFNFQKDIYGLHAMLSNYNLNIKTSMMEEGMLSYDCAERTSKKLRLLCKIRKCLNKKTIYDSIGNFYCFYPGIYKGKYNAVKIPLIEKGSKCIGTLQHAFGIDKNMLDYKEKYIFFTSVYDFEGGKPIGEFELVKKVAEIVGKDNLLIKVHPRDKRTLYSDYGFKVDKNSSIPWEVIQLSMDFDDKVFLTATSGSVLSGSFMSERPVETYYLYKLCDLRENYAQKTVSDIESLLNEASVKKIFRSIKVAERIEEIK